MSFLTRFALLLLLLSNLSGFSQNKWDLINPISIQKNKNVLRESFPKTFNVYQTSIDDLKNIISTAPTFSESSESNSIISIPNSMGKNEQFKVFEFSNFTSELQTQFPTIKSYIGFGIDDKHAKIRFSIDPNGIQGMIFRVDKKNEFIEPYSNNPDVYAVYESQRIKGQLAFTCFTQDKQIHNNLENDLNQLNRSSSGELLIFRLALSCTGEYATYHGGTVAGALAAMNATMTRVNGVFENDFAIHMNLIANNSNLIYLNAGTDPYTTSTSWSSQLQTTLTNVIGEANYDVGHLFAATGGGGNAGCIGCVCVDNSKGRAYTSSGIPMGDTFDIDYVAHEIGHQFGANHTFSHNVEGTGVNVEPGSGSTIMGYAGITTRDVQSNSDDYFVYASIKQVQDNMVVKTCPTRITLLNSAPIVSAGLDYTIPRSTPFILTGSAIDPNGDTLSYCWEQNNTATTQTGAASAASATKTIGPNWRSYDPVSVPFRYFPRIQSIVVNSATTPGLEINVEALSSVARTLNFVLTARDNFDGAGQTQSDEMVVTVNAIAGPFVVNSPNTALNWTVGTNETVTWNVAGTTANGVNCGFVDIYLSIDGGFTYPIILASQVPNDGAEIITVPNFIGITNRIMVKGNNHIFFDISNVNFNIIGPASSFAIAFDGTIQGQNKSGCQGATFNYSINYSTLLGYSMPTTFSVTGNPVGTTITFSPSSLSNDSIVNLTVDNTTSATPGFYTLVVTGTSGAITRNVNLYMNLLNGTFSTLNLNTPINNAEISTNNTNLNWSVDSAATLYTLQVATDPEFSNLFFVTDVSTNSYNLSGLSQLTNYYWRVLPKNSGCSGNFSNYFRFTTITFPCSNYTSPNVPVIISASGTPTVTSTLEILPINNVVITDLNVSVNISHSYTSDLTVRLTGPNNIIVNLVVNQCGGNDNIITTFDDSGTTLVCGTNPAISGTILPNQLLSVFNGINSQGTWTLTVSDNANVDGGTINSWSLNICTAPTPFSCGQISTIWNGSSWSNGKPANNVAATINGNLTIIENIFACSLNVIGNSQVVLSSGTNAFITNEVNIAPTASFTIQNNANLVQTNNVINTANATIFRNSNPLMRLDYAIWSSPVTGSQTLKQFSPNTLNSRFYNYNTTTNLYNAVTNPVTQTFDIGRGYLIRMPNNHPSTPTIWNGQFNGNLNNGNINVNLNYIGLGQSFNMVGNPYPSTIDADTFITDNLSNITGTLYFWRKINNAAGTAYATYTLGGETSTSPTSPTPNGVIQTGQGFIVEANNVTSPTILFQNSQRIGDNQNQIFRNSINEKHRIWLNLINDSGLFGQTMIGYMTNATNDFDNGIDGKYINDSPIAFNSLINNDEYAVQLKGLNFSTTDVFPMKFKTDVAGEFNVNIDHVDGLFLNNQNVYLKDNFSQVVHNLSESQYVFSSITGEFNNRFEIVFDSTLLSSTSNLFDTNSVVVYSNSNQIHFNSSMLQMNKITIYDSLGRLLFSKNDIKNNTFLISNLNVSNQALIILIDLENGTKVTKKIIY